MSQLPQPSIQISNTSFTAGDVIRASTNPNVTTTPVNSTIVVGTAAIPSLTSLIPTYFPVLDTQGRQVQVQPGVVTHAICIPTLSGGYLTGCSLQTIALASTTPIAASVVVTSGVSQSSYLTDFPYVGITTFTGPSLNASIVSPLVPTGQVSSGTPYLYLRTESVGPNTGGSATVQVVLRTV